MEVVTTVCHTHTHHGAEMGVKSVSESVSGVALLLGVGGEAREGASVGATAN